MKSTVIRASDSGYLDLLIAQSAIAVWTSLITIVRNIYTHPINARWMDNCIGRRNYLYFLGLLVALPTQSFYVLSLCVVQLVKGGESIEKYPVALALIVFCFFWGWTVAGMFIFHSVMLVSRNITTNEYVKSSYLA
jgi:DHHC palmitoyltransferase